MMEFRVLGPLEVVEDGRALPLGGTKQRALLACLLLRANQLVSTDRLIEELWPDRAPRTAAKTVQVYVSKLRKELGEGRLVTHPPGYVLRVDSSELDLARFEELLEEAHRVDPNGAAEPLREALALWRGPPLADLAYEPFAQTDIARLEELRLTALEERIEADLATGRHPERVSELQALVAEHPLRERLLGQLMLALYRSGRQAEALEVYQDARRTLVEELGLEPSAALQRLEKAILQQARWLDLEDLPSAPPLSGVETLPAAARGAPPLTESPAPERAIVVVALGERGIGHLLKLAAPLAASERLRELIATRVLETGAQHALAEATADLRRERDRLLGPEVHSRVAAFTSAQPGDDIVRLASQQDIDLLLLDVPVGTLAGDLSRTSIGEVLRRAPCDVALLADGDAPPALSLERAVLVPFGAAEHDWAALELGSWLARAHDAPLRLLGALSGGPNGRDASRLLADASILVQRLTGVVAEPLLARPGAQELLAAAEDAGALVIGFSDRWSKEGLGEVRRAIAEAARAPTLFVRRGLRPGGLAPSETRTRFTWSLGAATG
jgi:DNA-binding SARP family transcriptional activator